MFVNPVQILRLIWWGRIDLCEYCSLCRHDREMSIRRGQEEFTPAEVWSWVDWPSLLSWRRPVGFQALDLLQASPVSVALLNFIRCMRLSVEIIGVSDPVFDLKIDSNSNFFRIVLWGGYLLCGSLLILGYFSFTRYRHSRLSSFLQIEYPLLCSRRPTNSTLYLVWSSACL